MTAIKPLMVFLVFMCCSFCAVAAEPGRFSDVYFGTGGKQSKGIYHAKFDAEAGKLTGVSRVSDIAAPRFLTTHPRKNVLFAVARQPEDMSPIVVAYKISRDGALNFLNSQAIGDAAGTHISVHPSGRFLLTAQYGGSSVAFFPLNQDGSVKPRTQLIKHKGASNVVAHRQEAPHPHWVGFSPDGNYAFVPDLGLDQIVIYRVDLENLQLVPHGFAESAPGAGPRHMRFSADGERIYLLNELDMSVNVYAYDAEKGAATKISSTAALSEKAKEKEHYNSASEIVVHPNGRFVYSANRGHDSVTAYVVADDSGSLKVVEVEPIRGAWPRHIRLDTTGRWLLAAGVHSNTVSVFEVEQRTGELKYNKESVVNVPEPVVIEFYSRQ